MNIDSFYYCNNCTLSSSLTSIPIDDSCLLADCSEVFVEVDEFIPSKIVLDNTFPRIVEETLNISSKSYLSQGAAISLDICNNATCVNTATASDLVNFGYYVHLYPINIVCRRADYFNYTFTDNISTCVLSLTSMEDNWKFIVNNVVKSTGSRVIPIGNYSGTINLTATYTNG